MQEPEEQLEELLDEVECRKRLFPTRLWALQIVAGEELDELLEDGVLTPIAAFTGEARAAARLRFSPEVMLHPIRLVLPETWREQFLSDLRVFGLREAIVCMTQYDFIAPPAPLFANAVRLYHAAARLFLAEEAAIEASRDITVMRLRRAISLYGEGRPQALRTGTRKRRAR